MCCGKYSLIIDIVELNIVVVNYMCKSCRVPRNEDLFYGNMVDLGSSTDDSVLTYCTCDNYDITAPQCGRKAVSDTTADFVEPRTHVSLIVPVRSSRRRRRDAADVAGSGKDFLLNNRTPHPRHKDKSYKYV